MAVRKSTQSSAAQGSNMASITFDIDSSMADHLPRLMFKGQHIGNLFIEGEGENARLHLAGLDNKSIKAVSGPIEGIPVRHKRGKGSNVTWYYTLASWGDVERSNTGDWADMGILAPAAIAPSTVTTSKRGTPVVATQGSKVERLRAALLAEGVDASSLDALETARIAATMGVTID